MDAFITKGTKIRARWFKPKPLGTWSLAGAQLKFTGDMLDVTGIVRHVRSDDPVLPVNVTFHIDTDDNQGDPCPKCGTNHLTIDPKHVVDVLPGD